MKLIQSHWPPVSILYALNYNMYIHIEYMNMLYVYVENFET